MAVGVERAEADRQHELRRLEGHLQRAQVAEAEPRLLGEIHARHEELHVLFDIAAEDGRGAGREPITVVPQPRLEATALARGQKENVVLADGVARLDRHTVRACAIGGRQLFSQR
jgi:hypothetical protein